MRQALYSPPAARLHGAYGLQPTGRVETLGAPVGGLDTATPIKELPPEYTPKLENWLPDGTSLSLRRGYAEHVTGISDPVETLMPYNVAGVGQTLFAAAGTKIYNVETAGAVGAAVVSSLNSARFSHVNFTTSGGSFLWACNDSTSDQPRTWDGSSWSVPALTISNFNDTDIFRVFESKQRLFFLFRNSLTFGYLATESISGSVSEFPLGAVFARGGTLTDGASFTFDGGDGPDDYTCFLSSEGEVVVYSGTNPGSASAWTRVGTFYAGKPVGDRPFVQLGGDLGVITRNGLVQISQVFRGGAPVETLRYLTARISPTWRDSVVVGELFDGWEGLYYPDGDYLLINVPLSATTAKQYVRHQVTGGWYPFTDWNFETFALFNGTLYAGGSGGNVYELDRTFSDNGSDIIGAVQTPWSTLGAPGRVKNMLLYRPVTASASNAVTRAVGRAEYRDEPSLPSFPGATLVNALIWGTGVWGTDRWGGEAAGQNAWRGISGEGHAVSVLMEVKSNAGPFSLNAIDLMVKDGGPV